MEYRHERTFAMIKPDAFYQGRIADIVEQFEEAGMTISMAYTTEPDEEKVREHYSEVQEEGRYDLLERVVDYLAGEPVMPMVLEGRNSVEKVRNLTGGTSPLEAGNDTIRGKYSSYSFKDAEKEGIALPNLVHAADSREAAEEEIQLWLEDEHTIDYIRPDEEWLRIQSFGETLDADIREQLQDQYGLSEEELEAVYDTIINQF
ncbi:MAG: nucleoside-diphosphate kinase [Candidatus Nanohaloarchaea archaeon]|nr:nucleoside-diphosphate kinase [Candidatus Nanohaloarchaea archaeon]